MAELDPLIRVRRHTIEQKQKALAALYAKAEELKNKRDELETELAIEREKAQSMNAELLGYFVPYAESMKRKIDQVEAERDALENRIQMAQDDMRDAFAELKKVEIIEERRQEEAQAELDKKDADTLDDVAIDAYRRRIEGDTEE